MKYTSKLILNGETYKFGEAPWRDKETTFCYLPLSQSGSDSIGNMSVTNNYGVTFGQYQGVDCAEFSSSCLCYSGTKRFDTMNTTFLCRCYNTGVQVIDGKIFDPRGCGTTYVIGYDASQGYFFNYATGGGDNNIYIGQQQQNERVLLYVTTDIHDVKIGTIDSSGVVREQTANDQSTSYTDGFTTYVGSNDGHPANGYRDYIGGMSAMYIDMATRTSPEILAYYNQTKSLYGIS